MEAMVMREVAVNPSMYGSGKQMRGGERGWSRVPGLTMAAPKQQAGVRQKLEDWDNGDPPDLMLWGEE